MCFSGEIRKIFWYPSYIEVCINRHIFTVWATPCDNAYMCLRACAQCTNSDSSHACAKSYPGMCSPLIHCVVPNDSVRGHLRSWSACVDAQVDLGLRCPHMPKDTFSHGAAHMSIWGRFDLKAYKGRFKCKNDRITNDLKCGFKAVPHHIYYTFILEEGAFEII